MIRFEFNPRLLIEQEYKLNAAPPTATNPVCWYEIAHFKMKLFRHDPLEVMLARSQSVEQSTELRINKKG